MTEMINLKAQAKMIEIGTQIKEHLNKDISKEVTARYICSNIGAARFSHNCHFQDQSSTYTLLLKKREILLNTRLSNYSRGREFVITIKR
jgi:hypothetical protein